MLFKVRVRIVHFSKREAWGKVRLVQGQASGHREHTTKLIYEKREVRRGREKCHVHQISVQMVQLNVRVSRKTSAGEGPR